jgi:hypothetical protein
MNYKRSYLFDHRQAIYGPTMVRTTHIPFGLPSTPCHTPYAPTGTGTGHWAEFDLMKNQTTRNLQYKHPPICRLQR